MASNDPSRLISRLVTLLQDNPRGAEIWPLVTKTINSSVFPKERDVNADLPDAEKYLAFFTGALDHAIFRDVRWPPHAELVGIYTRINARSWAAKQVKGNLYNICWTHAKSLGAIAESFTRVFSQMGNYRFPLYITPTVAREWFDIWSLLCTRRMRHGNRSLPSPCVDLTDLHPDLRSVSAVVEGNLGRARRRYLSACGTLMGNGEAILADGIIMPETSDAEHIPAEQDLPSTLPHLLDTIHRGADPRYTVQMDASIPNFRAPRRSGDRLEAPSTKEARTPRDIEEPTVDTNLKDFGILLWSGMTDRLDVNQEDRERAVDYPLLGRSSFARIIGDNAATHLTHEVFDTHPYGRLGPKTPNTRAVGRAPVPIALAEAGALHVGQSEFCLLGGRGQVGYPPANSHFIVYKLPARQIRECENDNCS